MSAQTPVRPDTALRDDPRRSLRIAWLWFLAIPVSTLLGMAMGYVPYAIFTDQVEGTPGPWWFELIVAVLAFGTAWLPVGASLWWSRRALRAGSPSAWVPLTVGLILTAGVVVLVVVSVLA